DKNSGERREKTEWHNVVIFNEGIAKVAEQYLKKGSKVFVEGALQTRKWQDQSGKDRYSTEVVLQKFRGELVMLSDGRRDGDSSGNGGGYAGRSSSSGGNRGSGGGGQSGGGGSRDIDDEIPF